MPATYNSALNRPLDEVRLLIGDTDYLGDPVFQDEELEYFITQAGDSVKLAAARALRAIATNRARLARRLSVDGITEEYSASMVEELLTLAAQLENEAVEGESGSAADAVSLTRVDAYSSAYSARGA